MNTIQVDIVVNSWRQSEVLIAELAELSFYAFEENESMLSAFIAADLLNEKALEALAFQYHMEYETKILADVNWNKKWEKGFSPIVIDSFVAVRAPFHQTVNGVKHDIIISPKMSFGTGHHETTWLMLSEMREINFEGKAVLDFGTGTGILAILASKLGALSVIAIDSDEWSIENAGENLNLNKSKNVSLIKNDSIAQEPHTIFDVILINIGLNTIKENLVALCSISKAATEILLSGFLAYDERVLETLLIENNFSIKRKRYKNEWLCFHISVEKS